MPGTWYQLSECWLCAERLRTPLCCCCHYYCYDCFVIVIYPFRPWVAERPGLLRTLEKWVGAGPPGGLGQRFQRLAGFESLTSCT